MAARLKFLAIAIVLLARGGMEAQSSTATPSEYQVKAAFLYNFVKFVEWPSLPAAEVGICVIGKDPFGESLDRVVEGKSLDGRRFAVRRIVEIADARGCHVLFVGRSESKRAAEIAAAARGLGALTVSDIEGFAGHGGMIALLVADHRVRFQINAANAAGAGLKISSKLLQLALPADGGR
jgi:hypothetical protein